jgi:TonB family protein
MPVQKGNSVPLERRVHLRQRLSSIVYLDIGEGNGGIVLDMSEEGLGFHAAGPLGKQSEVRLRIKLPSSQTRIEVTAQIVWISDSNQKAGVRFLDAQSEGPVQIREWIRSQAIPPAPFEESSKQEEGVTESRRKQETIRELPTDNRLTLKSEFEIPALSRQKPVEVSGGGPQNRVPIAQEDPASSPNPVLLSQPLTESAKSPFAAFPAMQEEKSQATVFQTPSADEGLEPDGADTPVAAPNHEESSTATAFGWPSPISWTEDMRILPTLDPPLRPVGLFPSASESKTNSTPATVDTMFVLPSVSNRMLVWNRVAIAVFFVLCSVLCFGIGTWVGQIVVRRHSTKAAASPASVVPAAVPEINGNTGRNAEKIVPATAEKAQTEPVSSHSAVENRKFAPSMKSPDVLPVHKSHPSNHQEQIVATLTTAKAQVRTPPVAAALENEKITPSMSSPDVLPVHQSPPPNPPEQDVTKLVSTMEQESKPSVAPAPENSAATPGPRIVAGLILKPSDRFNPCYLTYRVEPVYPPEAQEKQIEGVVKIQQVIGADGRVRSVKLLSGPPLLVPAALEAVRYWRYLPALLNGQPIETEKDVEIEFRLPN